MTIRTKAALKAFFETNDTPSESNFIDLIDTLAELASGEWQDYSAISTIVGWSSYTIKKIYYRTINDIVFVQFAISGTSDAITATFTLPFSQQGSVNHWSGHRAQDNAGAYVWGCVYLTTGSDTVQLYKDFPLANWTAENNKFCAGSFWYEK